MSTYDAVRSGRTSPWTSSTALAITNAYAVQSRQVVLDQISEPSAETGARIAALQRNSARSWRRGLGREADAGAEVADPGRHRRTGCPRSVPAARSRAARSRRRGRAAGRGWVTLRRPHGAERFHTARNVMDAATGWRSVSTWSLGRRRGRRRLGLGFGALAAADRRPFPRHPPGPRCRDVGGGRACRDPLDPRARPRSPTRRSARRRRCCSSPRRSARPAARPVGPSPRWPRWSPGSSTSRSTPSTTSSWSARLGILRTPTTLVLDGSRSRGHPRGRRAAQGAGPRRSRERVMSTMWTTVSQNETSIVGAAPGVPYSGRHVLDLLTKRRAVDHCRVRSSLCRMR